MGAEKPFYLSSGILKRPPAATYLDVGSRRLLGYSSGDYIYIGDLMRSGGWGDAGRVATTSTYSSYSGGFGTEIRYAPPTGFTRVYKLWGSGYASVVNATPALSYKLWDYTGGAGYIDDMGGVDVIATVSFSAINVVKCVWSNDFEQGAFPDFLGGDTRWGAIWYAQTGGVGAGSVNCTEAGLAVFWKKT